MTQNERVLRYIHDNGAIDQGVTLDWSPPITRLAARIADLQEAGNAIENVGKRGKFAVYAFVDKAKDPRCKVCDEILQDVRPTISPDVVTGTCRAHGRQTVKR